MKQQTGGKARSQAIAEIRRRLSIPVAIDPTGFLRHGIVLRYASGTLRTLRPINVLIGYHARAEDISANHDIVEKSTLYNEELAKIRELTQRLHHLFQSVKHPDLLPCLLRRALSDFEQFDEVLTERQLSGMGNGYACPEALAREIAFLKDFRQKREALITAAEKA